MERMPERPGMPPVLPVPAAKLASMAADSTHAGQGADARMVLKSPNAANRAQTRRGAFPRITDERPKGAEIARNRG